MALSTYLDFTFDDAPAVTHATAESDETHLAVRTFRAAGGIGPVDVHAQFPGGRGMGFSGAARVAAITGAALQRGCDLASARAEALVLASELEGHADNVGASLFGGVVAVAGNEIVSVPLGFDPSVVVWIPASETSTKKSRTGLPKDVAFEDAVFNIGRVALFVAALASGNTSVLRTASQDRLHQDKRFATVPESFDVYEQMLESGAWCAWLSGSGPCVAALCDPEHTETIIDNLAPSGRALRGSIDTEGIRLL